MSVKETLKRIEKAVNLIDPGVLDFSTLSDEALELRIIQFEEYLFNGMTVDELKKYRAKIDLFINDSDHSYLNQKREYDISLNWLAEQGLLISDDVQNVSLLECYKKYGGTLSVVPQEKAGFIGLMRLA